MAEAEMNVKFTTSQRLASRPRSYLVPRPARPRLVRRSLIEGGSGRATFDHWTRSDIWHFQVQRDLRDRWDGAPSSSHSIFVAIVVAIIVDKDQDKDQDNEKARA